jgi:hypothetical protein
MPIPPSKYKEAAERERLKTMLREWYGERDGNLEIVAHDKKIRTLNELNVEFISDAIPANVHNQIELAARWQEIVSPQFAALVAFSSINEEGILFLEVRHSAFLQDELLKSADLLIERINTKIGKNICKEIRFVPSGRNYYTKK